VRLRQVGEFPLIERIARAARRGARDAGVVLGIGDDAALLRARPGEDVAVTTDALVEDVHFRWRSIEPETLGRRALAVNLSDLAAMGARPLGCLFALAAPPALELARLDAVVRGLVAEGRRHACPLVGGNVTRARETSLTITVVGAVARGRALRRDAARPGDRLCVTGVFGAAALERLTAECGRGRRERRVPLPRLAAGAALARLRGAGACIDVSDGLLADLGHLLQASGVDAALEPGQVPRPRGFAAACARLGLDPEALALRGGEDYELLFSVRPGAPGTPALARRLGCPVTEIGRIVPRRGVGAPRAAAAGWTHF